MDSESLVARFANINVWKKGDRRAPHKPLLLLITLARLQRRETRLAPYEELERPLRELLRAYGPTRNVQPELPFWWLQSDGLWEIPEVEALHAATRHLKQRGKHKSPKYLRACGARGGLPEDLWTELRSRPGVVNRIVAQLLEDSFPASLHDDILDAVGMPWVVETDRPRRRRDPGFRPTILRIYEHRCAVCGYDGRLGQSDLGLEAAHIKWHAAGGPDRADNGLALCVYHHKALDRGAISLADDHVVLVSQDVHGQSGVEEWLLRYSGQRVRAPIEGHDRPAVPFVRWHRGEVFHEPARAWAV